LSLRKVRISVSEAPASRFSTALKHHKLGQYDEAETVYRELVEEQPGYVPVLHNLGALMVQRGRHSEALPVLDRAIALAPASANIRSAHAAACIGLGKFEEALHGFSSAIRLKPESTDAWYNSGLACQKMSRHEEALNCFRKSLDIQPDQLRCLVQLGASQSTLDDPENALCSFDKALELDPLSLSALIGKAGALRQLLRFDEALACLDRALEFSPEKTEALVSRATLHLLTGNLKQGWSDFEARMKLPGWKTAFSLDPENRWCGETLNGKTILLVIEQGTGDNIQCLRYVSTLKRMGARIVVAAPPALTRLFSDVEDIDQVVLTKTIPAHDCWSPLFSLPMLIGEDHTRPFLPWVKHAPQCGDKPETGTKRKIGLVWAGDPAHLDDRRRSMSIGELSSLFTLPNVEFYSLQVGERSQDIDHLPGDPIVDLSPALTDYAATAAEIAGLDLVITVDTSVAHLAGSMGKAVWVMLPVLPDWRWGLTNSKTLWYPSMRLFRQEKAGDWQGVVSRIHAELKID
jgi:tetratricopeptide (TPR) repeat protein